MFRSEQTEGPGMIDKWLVLVSDENGHWSIAVQSSIEEPVREFEQEMVLGTDPSPRIVINTADYVQV